MKTYLYEHYTTTSLKEGVDEVSIFLIYTKHLLFNVIKPLLAQPIKALVLPRKILMFHVIIYQRTPLLNHLENDVPHLENELGTNYSLCHVPNLILMIYKVLNSLLTTFALGSAHEMIDV